MNYSKINFPYPVLKNGDDSISGDIDFSMPDGIIEEEDKFIFKINFNIDNEDIINLINEDKAEFLVEITCSSTLFRKVYKSNNNKVEFEIPKTYLKGKVKGDCLIVAKTDIPNYNNSKAHPDYNNFDINIKKGDVLAFFGSFDFTADIDYKKLKAVASFMEVEEDDRDYTFVDLDNNKILIYLPKEDFKLFNQDAISKEKSLAPIIHSSIVLNALLIALYNFNDYKEKLWAKAILYRMKNDETLKKYLGSDDTFEIENIPEIAQILLGNPISRLLKQLDENFSQDEEI